MLDKILEQKIEPGIDYDAIVVDWLRKTKIGNREDQITAVLVSTNIGSRTKAEELVDRVTQKEDKDDK